MFCQSQAFPIIKIARFCLAFYISKKVKCVEKKPEFQNLAPEKPNWQPCGTVNSTFATSYNYDATIMFFLIAQQ